MTELEPIFVGERLKSEPTGELLISTWNVWFDRHQRDARNQALLQELSVHRPHLMVFQEVTMPFVRAIQAAEWLKEGYWVSALDHNQIGVVMIGRIEPEKLYFHPLTSNMGRRLLVAEFPKAKVISSHFESNRSSGEVRATQFQEAVEALGSNGVLLGDFNSQAGDPEAQHLGSLRDAWTESHPEEPGYTIDTSVNRMVRGSTQIRIDRLMLAGDAEVNRICRLGTEPFRGEDHPSDHFGLLAEISLQLF